MSELLEAAASALGTPSALVQRAAAARASANGTTVDDVLAAWTGGAPIASTPSPTAEPAADPTPESESAPEPDSSPVAVLEAPAPPTPEPVVYVEETIPLEPVALGTRVKTAVRVGAWTGAALGLIGFLVATAFWAPNATVAGDGRAVVIATPRGMLIGISLVSIVFGAVVASLSRAAASWRDPAMQLTSSRSSTGWIGAALGLVLGVAGSALLTRGFGTVLEGDDPLVQLPVLATLGVMLVGGAILGGITAAAPQVLGTPVTLDDSEADEVDQVKGRIRHAITIPLAGVLILAGLVIPFAMTLFEANHLVTNGAAIIAIIAAGGILGFAALAGSKPNMKISFGEVMVAFIGIGTVVLVLLAVFVFRA